MASPAQPADTGAPASNLRRAIGCAIGLALIAAALWTIRSQQEPLQRALQAAHTEQAWLLAAALTLPLLNWLFTSGVFYFLMQSDRRGPSKNVPFREMSLLIGSAWLFNYLPMSPGMFGRIAYHKAIHQIPVKDSLRAVFAAMGLGVITVMAALCMAMIGPRHVPGHAYTLALAAPPVVLATIAWLMHASKTGGAAWRQLAACALRYLDVMVWVARYAAVFALVGRPLSLPESVAIAAVSQAAVQVPIVGNGLGIREWAVGLVAPALPNWMTAPGSQAMTQPLGLAADLINRGLEVLIALPVGIACTTLLAHQKPPQTRTPPNPNPAPELLASSRSAGPPKS